MATRLTRRKSYGFPGMVLLYASHGALPYVRTFGMRAKKNYCLLLLFVRQTVGDARVSLSVYFSPGPNLLYCTVTWRYPDTNFSESLLDIFRACVRHAYLSPQPCSKHDDYSIEVRNHWQL
jgi:hypothetical protein